MQDSLSSETTGLLTRAEVASLLHVHTETVKRMEHRGELGSIRLNSRTVRYHPFEIRRFIQTATKSAITGDSSRPRFNV